jgi:translation initiation factor eIF-2B subunit delta
LMRSDEVLRIMEEDRVHGASWYLERGIDALEAASIEGRLLEVLDKLRGIRRGMATLLNLVSFTEDALSKGIPVASVLARLRNLVENTKARLRRVINDMGMECNVVLITLSLSDAVRILLEERGGCIRKLYLMESRPGYEFKSALSMYSRYVNVVPITDSSLGHFLRHSDYAVVGADGVYGDGVLVNKVGTAPLLIVARELGVGTMVILESHKFTTENSMEPEEVTVELGVEAKVPLFDKVHVKYVDRAVTDMGVVSPLTKEAIEAIHREVKATVGLQ